METVLPFPSNSNAQITHTIFALEVSLHMNLREYIWQNCSHKLLYGCPLVLFWVISSLHFVKCPGQAQKKTSTSRILRGAYTFSLQIFLILRFSKYTRVGLRQVFGTGGEGWENVIWGKGLLWRVMKSPSSNSVIRNLLFEVAWFEKGEAMGNHYFPNNAFQPPTASFPL